MHGTGTTEISVGHGSVKVSKYRWTINIVAISFFLAQMLITGQYILVYRLTNLRAGLVGEKFWISLL